MLLATSAALALTITVAACGGGDDEADTTTLPTNPITQPPVTQPPVTQPPVTTPIVTTPTSVAYVTEGATVMVANASRVDGAAGRMSERLAAVGFQMVEAGNYSLGQLDVTKIYYDAANAQAQAVAQSIKAGLGGGSIEVLELPAPPPVGSGTVNGAGVLVAMGNDTADKTLEELQGLVAPSTTAPPTDSATASDTATATSAP